ncbi:hypothetical protein NUSPORA_00067 [Nucleospora cyclopteri]
MFNFVAIVVRKDNLMYLFYNSTSAFSVDSYDPEVIKMALSKELTPRKIYSKEEIKHLSSHATARQLLCAFTTHHHIDHSGGDELLKTMFPNLLVYSGKNLNDGQLVKINQLEVSVLCLNTPSHTFDSFCFLVADRVLLTGDLIFKVGCGRFFEGDSKQFSDSIQKIYKNVSDSALLLYGHDYGKQNKRFADKHVVYSQEDSQLISETDFLKLRDEKRLNPFLINYKDTEKLTKLRCEKDVFI